MNEISKRFAHWLSTLDPHLRRATGSPLSWIGLGLNVAGLLAIAAWLPEFFGLRLLAAALAFVPVWLLGVVGGVLEQRGQLSLSSWGVLALLNSALMHLFVFSLIALSTGTGSMLFAGVAILTSTFHGFVFRASIAAPFSIFAALVGSVAAFAWGPGEVQAVTMAVTLVLGFGLHLLLGHAGRAGHFEQRERQALRDAIQAQLLVEQAKGLRQVTRAVTDLRSNAHDAGNVLSSVLFNVQALGEAAQRLEGEDVRLQSIREIAEDLQIGLGRLQDLVRGNTSAQRGVEVETLAVREILDHLADTVASFHPKVELVRVFAPSVAKLRFPLSGGAQLLQRIVENLLLNACQGDGVRGAKRVELHAEYGPVDDEPKLQIEILDDGPGFPDHMLGAPVAAYQTTKAGGTGLGLYTVDRLILASGGHMRRSNRDSGGARVHVELPRGDR